MEFKNIFSAEKHFSTNHYHGFIENDRDFTYKKGSIPILVSVPHATFHMRNGKQKKPERYTGALGLALHELLDVHFITKVNSYGDDPNYSFHSSYRDQATKIIKNEEIKLVLDIHGAAHTRPFSVELGTANGKTAMVSTTTLLKDSLRANFNNAFIIEENNTFSASNPNTVTHDLYNRTLIETIQLEINEKLRSPSINFNEMMALTMGLASFIISHKERHL